MVGINGRVAGLIDFRHSTRLEAASTLRRLRSKRNLQVGIVSERPPSTLTPLAVALGGTSISAASRRTTGFAFSSTAAGAASRSLTSETAVSILASRPRRTWPFPSWKMKSTRWIMILRRSGCFSPGLPSSALSDIATSTSAASRFTWLCADSESFCVAGAFVWGFTSLASVVVTNLALTACTRGRQPQSEA